MQRCRWAKKPDSMMPKKRLSAFLTLCCAPLISACAQQSGVYEPEDATIQRASEAAGDANISLPIYPQQGRVQLAPFLGAFDVHDRRRNEEYRVQLWRRSDGSIRRTEFRPIVPFFIDLELNSILNYERSRLVFLVTVAGQLKQEPGAVDKPLEEGASIIPGDPGITLGWNTIERSVEPALDGVVGCPCDRLRLRSPSSKKEIEVWISKELQIVLREELTSNGALQHRYTATDVELTEPDASLFDLPASF